VRVGVADRSLTGVSGMVAVWITPGSLETVGSGKDGRYGSGEEVPGGVEGARGGDGA
jgi:hypothetical protein